nr:alpha/beta hydrolase [Actinopolymorpha cephalotaxi]
MPRQPRPLGTVVLLHGGFWSAAYGLDLMAGLATDLVGRGWAVWNLEYRRIGDGGGWPATFTDVATGIDHLADLPVRTGKSPHHPVVLVGHSAGGHLAAWVAGRHRLPAGAPGARPRVRAAAAISLAGVLDLETAAGEGVGGTSVQRLLGGTPKSRPGRYAVASPIERIPICVPVCCVHGRSDLVVPVGQSRRYVRAAAAAGDHASLVEVDGDHFSLIDPGSPGWRAAVGRLPGLAGFLR